MEFGCERKGEQQVLTIAGELTIEAAEELKSCLLQGVETSDRLIVDVEKVNAVDFACLQLFYAAHRTLTAHGKQLVLSGCRSGVFAQAMSNGGFLHHGNELPMAATEGKNGGME